MVSSPYRYSNNGNLVYREMPTILFQVLIGILTMFTSLAVPGPLDHVSSPYRYSNNTDQKQQQQKTTHVSSPYRYSNNIF